MNMMKNITTNITNYSWNIPEETYRNDEALSYSLIARYAREGFSCLPHLRDKQESNSLTLGSVLDCMVTEGMDCFYNKYFVSTFDPTIKANMIITKIYKDSINNNCNFSSLQESLNQLSEDYFKSVMDEFDYYKTRVFKTRITELVKYAKFWEDLENAGCKNIINNQIYLEATKMFNCLQNNTLTNNILFADNLERYFQIKFKATINAIDLRCMFDCLVIDNDTKRIIPIDLKTTSSKPWEFNQSFIYWRYDIQARLYTRILQECLKGSEFEDYGISSYLFIVCNKDYSQPVVFNVDFNKVIGDIEVNGVILEDPISIAAKLKTELARKEEYPFYLNVNKINKLFNEYKVI